MDNADNNYDDDEQLQRNYIFSKVAIDKALSNLEPQADAQVRPQRNGVPLHRRTEVIDQPADGKPGVAPRVQGRG